MTSPFVVGLVSAWVIAQLADGAFFMLAYALGRRERDYLAFALLSFAFAAISGAIAWSFAVRDADQGMQAILLAHAGGVLATVFNFHFVVRFTGSPRAERLLRIAYVVAAAFLLTMTFGWWWHADTVRYAQAEAFGQTVYFHLASPTWLALVFYPCAGAALLACAVLLYAAYRRGRREALTPLLGLSVVTAAALNDISISLGVVARSMYLLPHAFMVYAFGVAATLLYRYGRATGALEQTATDLERATEQLRNSHAELQVAQTDLERSRELATVGELAAAIAHEVRNPLAIIMNAVAGLRRPNVGEEDRLTLLEIVEEETARLNRLVNDLLRFARPVVVKMAVASLVELAEKTRSLSQEHRVIVSQREGAPSHVVADPTLLRQVMDNLVENACHAMAGGGDVHIVIDSEFNEGGRVAKVVFQDTGQGMSPEVLERALDPFFTTRPSGTGLGLPIVHRIVDAHGGSLAIDSEPGVGTRVTLRLPLHDADDETAGSEAVA
ncbi:MAG: ATP-binding protein [Polyangiaceae bacterium]